MIRFIALGALLVACKGTAATDTASSASATPVVSAPPVASSSPPSVVASAPVTAPVASASAAADDSGPPAWLHLGAGERFKHRNKVATCVTIVVKGGEEDRCEPMAAPAATVDDVTLPRGRDCPPGFAVSGSDYCSRACKSDADCHNKHKCRSGQCMD